jgi:phosphopantetheinyl transferase
VTFRLIRQDEAPPARPTADDLADAVALGPEQGARRLRRRGQLRAFAAEILEVHPDSIRFEREPTGRVRITAPTPRLASLSERGTWTAMALAEYPIGVDVEVYPPDRDPPFDLLDPFEQEQILAAEDPARMFLHFWTAREAYLKAQGRGLDVEPGAIRAGRRGEAVALVEAGKPLVFARIVERDDAIAAIVELTGDD